MKKDEENVKELTDKIIKDLNLAQSVKKGNTLESQIAKERNPVEEDVIVSGTTKSGEEIKRLQTLSMPHPVLSDLGYTGIYLKNMETGELWDIEGNLLYAGTTKWPLAGFN